MLQHIRIDLDLEANKKLSQTFYVLQTLLGTREGYYANKMKFDINYF